VPFGKSRYAYTDIRMIGFDKPHQIDGVWKIFDGVIYGLCAGGFVAPECKHIVDAVAQIVFKDFTGFVGC